MPTGPRVEDEEGLIISGFGALSPAEFHNYTETAQRFLASAYDSVEELLKTLTMFREWRRFEGQSLRGRLTQNEEDLLRAAILFTGAGLDATLKQVVRDTLVYLVEVNAQAEEKFKQYASGALLDGGDVSFKKLASFLIARNPRQALIEGYIGFLTAPSLQSAEQVGNVISALGIDRPDLRRRVNALRPLFVARNQIAHELDLQRPERPSDKHRRTRRIHESRRLAHEGLEVGQLIINEVVSLLGGAS
jgi:hypothetical protein